MHSEKQLIVPDGCMELIIHYGDPYLQFLEDGASASQPRSFVFGQNTKPLEIMPTGTSGIIAARFEPDGFAAFQSNRVASMENRAVPLTELFGEEGPLLEEEMLAAPSNETRILIIERFLTDRLINPALIDSIAKASLEVLLELKGKLSVDELAGGLGVSRRQLERRFSESIGLSPKQLSKVIRMQAALKKLDQRGYRNLAELAVENGYFDQAHFIKDFREFTGMSPGQFYSDNLKLSQLFIGVE